MDNLNRRLMGYLTREDIPASAIELNANNYSDLAWNVMYLPVEFNESSSRTILFYRKSESPYNTYFEQIGDLYRNPNSSSSYRFIYSDGHVTFETGHGNSSYQYFPTLRVGYDTTLKVIHFLSISTSINSNYGGYISDNALMFPNEVEYFVKVKTSGCPVYLKEIPSGFNFTKHPILIDNE